MPSRSVLAVVALAALAASGCSKYRDPIDVRDNTITVVNQTAREWHDIVVTVNDHFRGGAPRLAADSVLTAPLSQFQSGYGQRFAVGHQTVFKVEVTAKDSAGGDVKLFWGSQARR
jgi:hypothetical protein